MNDHFGSGDALTQSTHDEAELEEQPRADDLNEEERDDLPDWERMKSKKISNDQELIQSDPTSCRQNQKGNN